MTHDMTTFGRRKAPRLTRCALLFLDLLGVRAMNQGTDQAVERRLVALDDAVENTIRRYAGVDEALPPMFFSDCFVVAAKADDPAAAVMRLTADAAQLQFALTERGFFVRGGIALGAFHVGRGLIFGPALVEAYELESRHALHPRIVLSREAEAAMPREGTALMRDGDGWSFVNYLDPLLELVDGPDAALEAHSEQVTAHLFDHRSDKRIWEKYRWTAEYHNAFLAENGLGASPVDGDAMAWRFAAFAA